MLLYQSQVNNPQCVLGKQRCLSILFWNYRTATLVLAVLGAVTHLYGALTLTALSDEFDDADTGAVLGLTAYSYLSGFACLAGAVGVLKVNLEIT